MIKFLDRSSRYLPDYLELLYQENERLRAENAELRGRLAAVRERCEANNWMGTARMCDADR